MNFSKKHLIAFALIFCASSHVALADFYTVQIDSTSGINETVNFNYNAIDGFSNASASITGGAVGQNIITISDSGPWQSIGYTNNIGGSAQFRFGSELPLFGNSVSNSYEPYFYGSFAVDPSGLLSLTLINQFIVDPYVEFTDCTSVISCGNSVVAEQGVYQTTAVNNYYPFATVTLQVSAVPVPAAVWLWLTGSAFVGLGAFNRRKSAFVPS